MGKLYPQAGPVTDGGKEISSRNALTHGGVSEKLIVPGERQEDFDELMNKLLEEYSPETPDARNLVEDAALARELEHTVYSPEHAFRRFEFPNGIPPEYYSFTDAKTTATKKATPSNNSSPSKPGSPPPPKKLVTATPFWTPAISFRKEPRMYVSKRAGRDHFVS